STTVTNCSFNRNSASQNGGGVNVVGVSPTTITNSVFWGNTAATGVSIFYSGTIPTVTYSDVEGGWAGTGNFASDPLFTDAANDDLTLVAGSPCKDAGLDSVVTAPPFLTDANHVIIDLAGNTRIKGPHVDLGAYERQNSSPVADAGQDETIEATGPTT